MLKTLLLVLPILFPSWRFFKAIEPSPRVQWTVKSDADAAATDWFIFRPTPMKITPLRMLYHLFWNAQRNDALFVVSCAERIAETPNAHSIDQINRRILSDIGHSPVGAAGQWMQFRLMFVRREGTELIQEIVFTSQAVPIDVGVVA